MQDEPESAPRDVLRDEVKKQHVVDEPAVARVAARRRRRARRRRHDVHGRVFRAPERSKHAMAVRVDELAHHPDQDADAALRPVRQNASRTERLRAGQRRRSNGSRLRSSAVKDLRQSGFETL